MRIRSLARRAARYRSGTVAMRVSIGYAVVVVGTSIFVIHTYYVSNSLAATWLFLVTAPISIPLMAAMSWIVTAVMPDKPWSPLALLAFTAGGLLQSWLLWRLLRGKRIPA